MLQRPTDLVYSGVVCCGYLPSFSALPCAFHLWVWRLRAYNNRHRSKLPVFSKDSKEVTTIRRRGRGVKAVEQRNFFFAGDNVVQDFETLKEKNEKLKQMLLVKKAIHCLAGARRCWRQTQTESLENQLIIKKVAGIDPKSRTDHVKPHASYRLGGEKHKNGVEYETGIPEAEASSGC
ncbi:hypothetical protein JB92DRAFT_2000326 [Gautieria morchelliformis]|nr:hypothetical protein JB92DRAFT_2000326 [Gautieria morchelliformis]